MGDGSLRSIDAAILELLGHWTELNRAAIYTPRPAGIEIENRDDDFLLRDGDDYYLFCDHIPMIADPNVAKNVSVEYDVAFRFERRITSAEWLDNGEPVEFIQKDGKTTVKTVPFNYGRNTVIRVVRLHTEAIL